MTQKDTPIYHQELPFRPRARILQLLGDQLIGSSRLAVFELVKNAYDADATQVLVTLNDIDSDEPSIVVEDDGTGMSLEIIENIWLVPAHDHRGIQRHAQKRTPHGRLPLGEKGLGRFAVHKLGDSIELITRAADALECVVRIDWNELIEQEFLADANVKIEQRQPLLFQGDRTGTKIIISQLREKKWNRGEIRKLYRQLMSIISPFADYSDSFEVILRVPEHTEWIDDLSDVDMLLERAPWYFSFTFKDGKIDWKYKFNGVKGIKLEARRQSIQQAPLLIVQEEDLYELETAESKLRVTKPKSVLASAETANGIGPVRGEFYVFDREPEILGKLGERRLVTDYLDRNGGVRVYRDNIRVYNYGEQGDDWLGLDLRRVNTPAKRISRNIVIGAIFLSLAESVDLQEKTNREGFVENDAYQRLREMVIGAISIMETERKQDKDKIKKLTGKGKNLEIEKIRKPLEDLRKAAKKHNVSQEFDPLIDKAENKYDEMRQVMLNAGFSGTGLAVVFHEIEHGVKLLCQALDGERPLNLVKAQAQELAKILEGFSDVTRKKEQKTNSLKKVLRRAREMNQVRFRKHNVKLVCPALEENFPDIQAIFSFSLALGAINNLLDNAFYWLKVRWPESDHTTRAIFMNIDTSYREGPAIVVADNGTGLEDSPDVLVTPFFSRRPDGMGLGLYYINMAMELNRGMLAFPTLDDVDVPEAMDGALFALVFGKKEEKDQ